VHYELAYQQGIPPAGCVQVLLGQGVDRRADHRFDERAGGPRRQRAELQRITDLVLPEAGDRIRRGLALPRSQQHAAARDGEIQQRSRRLVVEKVRVVHAQDELSVRTGQGTEHGGQSLSARHLGRERGERAARDQARRLGRDDAAREESPVLELGQGGAPEFGLSDPGVPPDHDAAACAQGRGDLTQLSFAAEEHSGPRVGALGG
jgi:hypothetical protein